MAFGSLSYRPPIEWDGGTDVDSGGANKFV